MVPQVYCVCRRLWTETRTIGQRGPPNHGKMPVLRISLLGHHGRTQQMGQYQAPQGPPGRQAGQTLDQKDRKSVVSGKSEYVRVDIGGRRNMKKKKTQKKKKTTQ